MRAAVLSARRAVPGDVRRAEAEELGRRLVALLRSGDTVCAYVPVGSEPGSTDVLDSLVAAGVRVLLPVTREDDAGHPLPLTWGDYRGELVAARFGLREPPAPYLPAETIGMASTVVVPALAVDRFGSRLAEAEAGGDQLATVVTPGQR